MKVFAVVLALALPLGANAVGPVQPQEKIAIKTEQFKGIAYSLEQHLGRPLNAEEKREIARDLVPNGPIDTDTDKLIIKVSCVKTSVAKDGSTLKAVCADLQSGLTYELSGR